MIKSAIHFSVDASIGCCCLLSLQPYQYPSSIPPLPPRKTILLSWQEGCTREISEHLYAIRFNIVSLEYHLQWNRNDSLLKHDESSLVFGQHNTVENLGACHISDEEFGIDKRDEGIAAVMNGINGEIY